MTCAWCRCELGTTRATARFCSRRCRQAAFRLRRSAPAVSLTAAPLRFAYADPPYPGLSSKYFRRHPDFAGEVDHTALVSSLERRRSIGDLAGWALSTSSRALATVLSLVPGDTRVCCWAKLLGPGSGSRHDFWEPLVVVGGRPWRNGFSNLLIAATARGGRDRLIGRKPIRFCLWLFEALGMQPGDELDDMFPGTGGVAAAWRELSSGPAVVAAGATAARSTI